MPSYFTHFDFIVPCEKAVATDMAKYLELIHMGEINTSNVTSDLERGYIEDWEFENFSYEATENGLRIYSEYGEGDISNVVDFVELAQHTWKDIPPIYFEWASTSSSSGAGGGNAYIKAGRTVYGQAASEQDWRAKYENPIKWDIGLVRQQAPPDRDWETCPFFGQYVLSNRHPPPSKSHPPRS